MRTISHRCRPLRSLPSSRTWATRPCSRRAAICSLCCARPCRWPVRCAPPVLPSRSSRQGRSANPCRKRKMHGATKLPGATVRPSERQLRRIALVRECAQLGARQRTIELLTGLTSRQVAAMLDADHFTAPRGRPPNTPDWYHGGTMLDRTEASVFAISYRRLRGLDFEPLRALLGGYPHHRSGGWAGGVGGLGGAGQACSPPAPCADWGCQYLTNAGLPPGSRLDCPFCRLQARYRLDPRVQMCFPTSPLPDPAYLEWALSLKAGLQATDH